MNLEQNSYNADSVQAFTLNTDELNYIVSSVQSQISKLAIIKPFTTADEALSNHKKIMELMRVLESFYIHKTWCNEDLPLKPSPLGQHDKM